MWDGRDGIGWLTMQSAANQSPQQIPSGNFAKSGPPPRFSCLIGARIQELTVEFPTQRNREFPNTYQGKFFKEQGISNPRIEAIAAGGPTGELCATAVNCKAWVGRSLPLES